MENEQNIEQMLEKMSKIPGMPRSARIEVRYDKTLQKITGRASVPAIVSEGMSFLFFLDILFFDHPEIPATYPPGVLGFLLEGASPKNDTPILDGDLLEMFVREEIDGASPSPFRF